MGQAFPIFLNRVLTPSEATIQKRLERLVQAGNISPERAEQRLARDPFARPDGDLVMFYAGTENAVRTAVDLFQRVQDERPDVRGILALGADIAAPQTMPKGCIALAAPEDHIAIVHRFLGRWQPDLVLWLGGQFQPNLIVETTKRGVAVISIDTADGGLALATPSRVPGLRAATLRCFDHVISAGGEQAAIWRRAGVDKDNIEPLGFLGEGAALPHMDEELVQRISDAVGTRPVWFAAGVQVGEIPALLTAHRAALKRSHRALLAISLADADAAAAARDACSGHGMQVGWAVDETTLNSSDQILIVPASEQDLWHRIAPISFLGSSLQDGRGIDPSLPAALGSAIVHGPQVSEFSAAYSRLSSEKASLLVKDAKALCCAVEDLLAPDKAAALANAAWTVTSAGAEATDRVNDLIQDFLDLRERLAS